MWSVITIPGLFQMVIALLLRIHGREIDILNLCVRYLWGSDTLLSAESISLFAFYLGPVCLINYLKYVITFSLQLEIRHMNSRFEAYEPNDYFSSEDLPKK